jgi:outer membrane protein assembly factor BamA
MMHDALVVILAGCALSGLAVPLLISRVETTISPPNPSLKLVSGLSAGDPLDSAGLSRAEARITDQLAAEGYLSAGVEARTVLNGDSVTVRFLVQTGRPARIGGWHVSEDSGIPAEKLSRWLPGRGTRFSRAVVDRAAASILSAYENGGYPFAAVTPSALAQESGYVYPALQVSAGPKVEVAFLEFAGKPGTKPVLLERVAGFSRGSYSSATMAVWRQRLEQSGLVVVDSEAIVRAPGAVAERALGTVPAGEPRGQSPRGQSPHDVYGVRFWVTGRRVNSASGVAGYSPADRKLTGLARISFHNLFDTGRRLEAGWQSAYARTSYRLSYTEPWVLGTSIDVTASARQQTVDTTSAQTNLALSASALAATWTTVSFETGYDRFTDILSRTTANVVWVGTGVGLDSRDFPPNPRNGVRLSASTKVGNRATDSAGSGAVAHAELGLTGFLPWGRSLAWSNSVGLRAVYSAMALTESELYRLGGPGTVRGYREDEFTSTRVGWFNTELRYSLDRTSSVFPFLDAGVYQDSLGWHVRPGYGAGTRVATQVGVLGLDYGIAFRDNPLRGKVHLSYDVAF